MREMDSEWDITRTATEVAVVVLSKRKAETYGTHARTTRAIVVMVPEDKPEARRPAEPAPEEEAPMHDDIPDDPAELQAALVAKIGGIADLIELKRREGRDPAQGHCVPEPRGTAGAPQRLSG
ncbi:hypothetical protein [Caulobacter henricii]|uniref:hypothetical protein n=1 Tax=Caulobacter henricii TaxID=69395 RepID=UPI001F2E8435|nr:hypothetical protein [Caulobacter henricii]